MTPLALSRIAQACNGRLQGEDRVVDSIATADVGLVPLDLGVVAAVVGPVGLNADVRAALRSDAPFAPELLRAVPAR